jgi:hypothetical protein
MFHAHVTEFTDLGWMGFFDVKDRKTNNAWKETQDTEPK